MSDGNGKLPTGWAVATFGDIIVQKVEQVNHTGPLTYIDIGAVNNGTKRIEEPNELCKDDKIPSRARQLVAEDDVLVSMTRPNLNAVAKVPHELDGAIASTGFDVLRAIEVESGWLFNTVKSRHFVDSMSTIVQGALYPAVRPSDIREYELPLPPLAEQRRIVSKIESLQERSSRARDALSEVGPLLDQFRQSVLRAAFTGRLTADWRAAHPDVEPAYELLTRIRTERRHRWEQSELAKYQAKDKQPLINWQDKYQEPEPVEDVDLPKLPDGWCWVRFEQCAWEITVGHVGPMKHRYVDEGVTMLRSQNVRPLSFELENCEYIPPEFDEEIRKSRLTGNEILVVRSGVNVGDCCVYPESNGPANCSDLVITRPLPGLNPHFGAMYVVSPTGKATLRLQRVGNAQPHFNVGSMKRSLFPLAPEPEQQQVVDFVYAAMERIEELETMLVESESALTQLDQSILAKAFRGKLVPQDPRDEPASELLARIRANCKQTEHHQATPKNTQPPRKKKAKAKP